MGAPVWVDEALDIIRVNALRASEVDWDEVAPRVRKHAATSVAAGVPEQALGPAFKALRDSHSFVEGPQAAGYQPRAPITPPTGRLLDRIRSFEVPAIRVASDSREATTYVTAGLRALQAIDKPGPVLVDLRANSGGNCFPMLAVVAPLLGVGELVSFRAPTRAAEVFSYDGDGILFNGKRGIGSGPPVRHAPPRLAVLTGPTTGSSGEIALLALRDREHVRTFGLPTAGLTTANQDYPLADGFMLYLAVSLTHSSTGVAYDGPVKPHVLQGPPDDVRFAHDWLNSVG